MIVSIEEARKILGDEARDMSDEEVVDLVNDLDVMAQYALKEAIKQQKANSKQSGSRN